MIFSPLLRARLEVFRRHARGFWACVILAALCLIALAAPLVANDRPLVMRYHDQWYFPVLVDYPETTFGGTLETPADYRDPFVARSIESKGWMLWPPIRYRYDTLNYALNVPAPAPPGWDNLLGTDDTARDVMARVIYGFRVSIAFGFALTVLSSIIGIAAGAVQGYCGGLVDLIFQRVIEIWSGIPVLYLLIILASLVQPSLGWLLVLMLLFSWMTLVGVVRAEFLRTRTFDYVRAARALGASHTAIIVRHILPNALTSTISYLPFILTGSITTLTALDFLGFGLPPGSPSLGELLNQGKNNLQAPWLALTGFVVIGGTLTLLMFIGEGVRDACDPNVTPALRTGSKA